MDVLKVEGLVGVAHGTTATVAVSVKGGEPLQTEMAVVQEGGVVNPKPVPPFEFTAAGLAQQPLEYTVLGRPPSGAARVLGVCSDRLRPGEPQAERWLALQRPDKGCRLAEDWPEFGRLCVRYTLSSPTTAALANEAGLQARRAARLREFTTLTVTVLSATGLADAAPGRQAFASLLLGCVRHMTDAKPAVGEPRWDTAFVFDLDQAELGPSDRLHLTVWDPAALGTPQELLGEAHVDLCGAGAASGDLWCTLEPRTTDEEARRQVRNRRELGQVQLRWEFTANPNVRLRHDRLTQQRRRICEQ